MECEVCGKTYEEGTCPYCHEKVDKGKKWCKTCEVSLNDKICPVCNKENIEKYKENYINKLWKCRDFELTHFWQRSVFLTAFLVLIYTAYGLIWTSVFSEVSGENEVKNLCIYHIISVFVMALGCLFSTIWILMAKGSKFWYEVYETKIWEYENDEKNNPTKYMVQGSEKGNAEKARCLFNTDAYKYSVSRINIVIGQISLIICYILVVVHTFCASYRFLSNPIIIMVALFVLVLVIFFIEKIRRLLISYN